MLDIPSTPDVGKNFRGQIEQSQCFIEIAVSEKTRIRCYLGAVKFELYTAIESDLESFTLWVYPFKRPP